MKNKEKLLKLAENLKVVLEYGDAVLEGMRQLEKAGQEITQDKWKSFTNGMVVHKTDIQKKLEETIVDLERFDRFVDIENRLERLEGPK